MATTIDKYVLETSVTGMSDVNSLDTAVKTLGKSIDAVTSKKIAMTINTTGFDGLNTTLSDINTALTNIGTKTVKPSISINGLDQTNLAIRSMSSALSQLDTNNVNIKVNDSDVTNAKGNVSLLNNEIDKVNGRTVSIKADNGPESLLGQNLANISDAFKNIATNAIAAVGIALAAMTVKTVDAAGALTDLSNASSMTTSELEGLKRSIIDAGGSADDGATFVNKLLLSITDAATGSKSAIDAFKALKVPIKDSNGEMRSTTDIARDLVLALGNTTDKTKQQALATELLGKSLSNLNFKDIKFQDDATLNNQIKKIDEVGGAWDRLGAALSKLGFSAVSGEASKMEGALNKLTWVVEKITGGFDLMNRQLPIIGSGFEFLGKLMNPAAAIMEKYGNAVGWVADKYKDLAGWIGKMGNVVPPQFQAAADAAYKSPAASKDAFDMSKGYRGKGYRDQRLPAIKEEQYGTPKPSGGGGGGGADAAAREAEARKRAREESEAELKAMEARLTMEQYSLSKQALRFKLNKDSRAEDQAATAVVKQQYLDLVKVEAEITKEKLKGAAADNVIISNLRLQQYLINENADIQKKLGENIASNALTEKTNQENMASSYSKVMEQMKSNFTVDPKTAGNDEIKSQIAILEVAKKRVTEYYDLWKGVGDTYGYTSDMYSEFSETAAVTASKYIEQLRAQKQLVDELTKAETERSQSFAGQWQSAMEKMQTSLTDSYSGSEAFNDLWGSITSNINNAISSGKFKFADFRDAIINDLAAIARKALASKLTSWLINTFVGSSNPISGAGAGAAIGGDKGGSAFLPKASGGAVGANQPYIVGERGPELFMPGRSGTIVPNRNLGGDSKPQVVNNYTYNVSAVDGQSVARFFMENKNMVAAANSAAKKERS